MIYSSEEIQQMTTKCSFCKTKKSYVCTSCLL